MYIAICCERNLEDQEFSGSLRECRGRNGSTETQLRQEAAEGLLGEKS